MDRIYVFAKKGKWYSWEAKAAWGELREAQRVWAEEAKVVGIPHVVGGFGEMRARLVADGVCGRGTGEVSPGGVFISERIEARIEEVGDE